MHVFVSDSESRRFGVTIARADDFGSADWDDLQEFCRSHRVLMAVIRVPVSDMSAVHLLERQGALLMDTLVYLEMNVAPVPSPACEGFSLRFAMSADLEGIRRIVIQTFTSYPGHYHADPRFDPASVAEGYADWVLSQVEAGDLDTVCVALSGGSIVGVSTIKAELEQSVGHWQFCAVAPEFRQKGVAMAFVQYHLNWCAKRHLKRFCTSTQIANLQSLRLMTRLGLRPNKACYTFHKWFETPAVVR